MGGGVDPDRVYLLGYSAGGDGVWQLAPRMADRFAAAAMMAGHPNEAGVAGLRNLPFGIFMGGADAAYDRNRIAAEKSAELAKLHAADPGGYLARLADETGEAWVVAEKILEGEEQLPDSWRCAGTTGYDTLLRVQQVLTSGAGDEVLDRLWSERTATVAVQPGSDAERRLTRRRDTTTTADGALVIHYVDPQILAEELAAFGPELRVLEPDEVRERALAVGRHLVDAGAKVVIVACNTATGAALELLRDPAFDALVTGSSPFEELPDVMRGLADGTLPALCHTITYDEGHRPCSA